MKTGYELVVSSPKTASNGERIWYFSAETENVLTISAELKREKREITFLTARIHDPRWEIFNGLPDPSVHDVEIRLTLARPGDARNPPVLVFDGVLTELSPDFPSPSILQLVAHDRSVQLRRQHSYKLFKGKNSKQIVEAIAKQYGLTVDADTGTATLVPRAMDIGAGEDMTDWSHLARSLHADGLDCYVEGKTIKIRQKAKTDFPITFKRGDDQVIKFQPKILHVPRPGKGGDNRGRPPEVTTGTIKATSGTTDQLAAKEKAVRVTHQAPMGGHPDTSNHKGSPHANSVEHLRNRKDSATLTVRSYPEIRLHHIINVSGWGGKADGAWHIDTIRHDIVAASATTTTLSLKRSTSPAAAKSAGVSGLPPEVTTP